MSRASTRPGARSTDRAARGRRAAVEAAYERGRQDGARSLLSYAKGALDRQHQRYWDGYADAVTDLGALTGGLTGDPVEQAGEQAPAPCDPLSGLLNRPRVGRQGRSTR